MEIEVNPAMDAESETLRPTVRHTLHQDAHFQLIDKQLPADGVAAFDRNGFIAVDDVISPAEIVLIRNTLIRLHRNNVGFSEGANFDAVAAEGVCNADERRFPQILNPRVFAPELADTAYFKLALGIAKQLLGETARFKIDISFMKPPRIGSETAWHQDEAFASPAYDQRDVTIWLALTRADSHNSCLSYIPGSNNLDILPHQPLGGDPRVPALECIGGFDADTAVAVPLDPGSVSIHGSRTLHSAGANHSNDVRIAYALLFEVPPVYRKIPHDFPWRAVQRTDRGDRLKRFRRRGGILIHIWRERHRLSWSMILIRLRRR
jgi:ectoine hydroxylase-related dioxygenase (phytanoyl-CoA dioxygenase family)